MILIIRRRYFRQGSGTLVVTDRLLLWVHLTVRRFERMDNQKKYKGFGEQFKEATRGNSRYLALAWISIILIYAASHVGYGGVVFLLIMTYVIWKNEREVRLYYKTGEFPQAWKSPELFYGKRGAAAFARVFIVIQIAVWLWAFHAVITGTFPWSGH